MHISSLMIQEMSLVEIFKHMNFLVTLNHDRMKLNSIQIRSDLQRKIHEARLGDEFIQKKKGLIEKIMEKILGYIGKGF